ncbi:MAG: COP23 domain-containing protein [Leptolyngbya sp. Prado105]|jgi:hypothetical protein|nr:COP23 domain-containing protein [Leptolyngbya sp. Prado105]
MRSTLKWISGTSAVFLLTTLSFSRPAQANETTFTCSTSQGTPTTVAQTSEDEVPIIRFNSSYFNDRGWSPERRCQEVSARFQRFHQAKQLRYITVGTMNRQRIVCVAESKTSGCLKDGLLFTLKPTSNANATLRQLFGIKDQAAGPLSESRGRAYIDINELLSRRSNAAPRNATPKKSVW